MITPSGIIENIRLQLNETESGFYSDNELYNYLTQSETYLANHIGITNFTSEIVASGNLREYAKPDNAQRIYRLEWNKYPLMKIDINDLDYIEGASYNKVYPSGTPMYYYEESKNVGLSPIPDSDKILKFYYNGDPLPLTSNSTEFTIPNSYAFYLIDYVLYRCYLKDQDNRSSIHLQIWNDNVRKAKTEYKKSQSTNKRVIVADGSKVSRYDFLRI